MHVQLLSHVWFSETPWTIAHQTPLSLGFPRKKTGMGCHFLLPDPGIAPASPVCLLYCRQFLYWAPQMMYKVLSRLEAGFVFQWTRVGGHPGFCVSLSWLLYLKFFSTHLQERSDCRGLNQGAMSGLTQAREGALQRRSKKPESKAHWLWPLLLSCHPHFFSLWKLGSAQKEWAPKSLQVVIATMKLKDACSLEEKLWPT